MVSEVIQYAVMIGLVGLGVYLVVRLVRILRDGRFTARGQLYTRENWFMYWAVVARDLILIAMMLGGGLLFLYLKIFRGVQFA